MKLAFVILNYGTFQETRECVSSIKEHIDVTQNEYNITIVDNGSTDDSLMQLEKLYSNESNIDIIPAWENLGFARGNNLGIKHVNEKYSPKFVVALNSDTEIFQNDLYSKLSKEYENSHFGLLGPMMTLIYGQCNNSPWKALSITQLECLLSQYKKKQAAIQNGTIYLEKVKNKIKDLFKSSRGEVDAMQKRTEFWKYQTDVVLQGACIIFSKDFFKYEEGFDSRTFLYFEEQLVYLSVKRHGLKAVYDPEIAILHKDGRATKKVKFSRDKLKFINQCNIDSLEILIETMKADGME